MNSNAQRASEVERIVGLVLVWNDDALSVGSRLEKLERVALQVNALITAAKAIATAEG